MKGIVTKHLNKRIQGASLNAQKLNSYEVGDIVEIVEILNGDDIDGNNVWYRLDDGAYVWSGGIAGSAEMPGKETVIDTRIQKNWTIEKFGIDKIWETTKGKGVKVAILDSGAMLDHPDLAVVPIIATKNFLDNSEDVTDNVGHGTHCAGIIAGQNEIGVAPEVSLLIGKVTDTGKRIEQTALFNGLKWAYESEADIISVSLTLKNFSQELADKVLALDKKHPGILFCSLSNLGDMGRNLDYYPALLDCAISVGSINEQFRMDVLTARSSKIDILGPGRDINSTWNNGGYKVESGCSMATPFVAGVFALEFSRNRNIKKADLKKKVFEKSTSFASFKYDPKGRYPIINP